MSRASEYLSDDEIQRQAECVLEPIRFPGAVQQHGVFLAVDAETFAIVHASVNALQLLGVAAGALLDTDLAALTGDEPVELFRDILDESTPAANPAPVHIQGRPFDVIVHRDEALVFIEFEPAVIAADLLSAPALYSAMHRLARATTPEELWQATAREVHRLTHFDQVMVYRFHPDAHGEVVGEVAAEGAESYLGLHFPASDIPAQARELYLTKLSRVIVNSSVTAVDIVGPGTPLDLSLAELRSVSPHHLQFMRNMGQASTLSISLISAGELIGMITCAHSTPRRIPFALRQGLEILANQVALQLSSMREILRLQRQQELFATRSKLLDQLTDNRDMADALLYGDVSALDLIPADGVAMSVNGRLTTLGNTPTNSQIAAFVALVARTTGGLSLVTDALPIVHPELATTVPSYAGVLLIAVGGEGDYIVWFRREVARSVNWMGDLSPANRATTLSPRTSFSSWNRSVSNTAVSWNGLELEAAALCRGLVGALLHRAESKLASLALHDALTGLPNRRLLMDRLEHALTKYARGEELALLFIDLDGFKAVNDSLGHDAGDELLRHVSVQLLGATRAQDTVARLGGDEFVVICENTTAEEAMIVAARISGAVRAPVSVVPGAVSVTASIGIAAANLSFSAPELLKEADAAMYRAKSRGRDQVSR